MATPYGKKTKRKKNILNIQKKTTICLLVAMTSTLAVFGQDKTESAFTMTTTFAKNGWEKSPTPKAVSYGNGYIFVRTAWKPVPVEQGVVRYKVWVRNMNTDWESADTLKVEDSGGTTAWMQDLYIPDKANKNNGVRGKLSFGYRPAKGEMPQVMPLKPGTYNFELCAQRIFEDGKTEFQQHAFVVTINPTPANLLILSGIVDYQVFQRSSKKTGNLDFSIINDNVQADYEVIVKSGEEEIARISGTCSSDSTTLVNIKDIPVGGPYTVEIKAGEKSKTFKDIYVGDLWIVSGQSNAVGCGYDTSFGKKPMAGVHCLAPTYGRWIWGVAKDGFFGAYVGPWVTAAQEFYKQTGVPVGLMGHAAGGQAMDFFMDNKHQDMPFLKGKVEQHGANAALFMWYQGESDTFRPEAMESYDTKLVSMAKAMRSYTGNPELKIGIVQISKYLWFKDEHFAEMREIQRQFVLNDKNSILFSTIGYEVNNKDKIHLTAPGQVDLGNQMARTMTRYEQTGELNAGPALKSIKFANKEKTKITVEFMNGDGLSGSANNEWFIKDKSHQGFKQGGFVEVSEIEVQPETATVIIDLITPVGDDASLSYGYQCNVGGTLMNVNSDPASAFVDQNIE
jgi:hypothetical protein